MSDKLSEAVKQVGGVALAHSALFVTLVEVLKARGVLEQADINEIIDLALVGVENADHEHAGERDVARRLLEDLSVTMAGAPGEEA